MAVTYPEILNDVLDAHDRYEVDGVQFVAALESENVPAGGGALLVLHVQSAFDQPLQFTLASAPPPGGMTGFLRKGPPTLKIDLAPAPQLTIELAPAEVGIWRVPIGLPATTPARPAEIGLVFKSNGERGQRVRASKALRMPGHVVATLDDLVGFGVVPVIGSTYESRDGHRINLKVNVTPPVPETLPPDLTPNWTSLWTQNEMSLQGPALREINNRRLHFVDDLGKPELFDTMRQMAETRLRGSGLIPHAGETLALAKILTYTIGVFMHDEESQNALLVPAFVDTMHGGGTLAEVTEVLSWTGFRHLLRLAIGVSFKAVAQATGRQPWSLEERRGVTSWVSESLAHHQAIPPEFLYIPLMLGALTVMPVRMSPAENVVDSFKALGYAWQSRLPDFKADPELAELVSVFDTIARGVVPKVMKG